MTKFKVYYLDDEPDLCEAFLDFFSSETISIQTFVDPHTAIAAIKKARPDLFFVDFRLPGMNGDQVAQAIDASIPKILVSGELDVKTQAHFVEKFSKPFDFDKLGEIIQQYAARKKG